MHDPGAIVLAWLIAWILPLLLWMEGLRCGLVLSGEVPSNGLDPGNSTLSPFTQRLARAHANCLEGLPIFGGLLIGARIVQSSIQLASLRTVAVKLRFAAFALQMAIGVGWAVRLLLSSA